MPMRRRNTRGYTRFISDNAQATPLFEHFAIESGPEFVNVDGDYPRLPDQSGLRVSSGST